MPDNVVVRPDFVIVGVQDNSGQFFLFASKDLSTAELRSETDIFADYGEPAKLVKGVTRHYITAQMGDFVVVMGDSYGQCFSGLMEQWNPDRSEARPAPLPAATRELGGRSPRGIGWAGDRSF